MCQNPGRMRTRGGRGPEWWAPAPCGRAQGRVQPGPAPHPPAVIDHQTGDSLLEKRNEGVYFN